MISILRRLLVVCSILVLQIPHAVAASYQAVDLATFDVGVQVTVSGINNLGTLAGTIFQSNGISQAFTWTSTTGFQYLSPLQGFSRSVANGINDNGQVIGYSIYSGYRVQANLWEGDSAAQELSALSSGEFSQGSNAYGINNNGQIVGSSTSSHGYQHAVLWTTSSIEDLNGKDDLINASANAINDGDTVVGQSSGRAFVWNRDTGMSYISGQGYAAVDINNSGQVLCQQIFVPVGGFAYLWQEGHDVISIGAFSGSNYTSAYDINNAGQVVGKSGGQAFVWDSTNGIQALPLNSGLSSGIASVINDNGIIAGRAFDALGNSHLVACSLDSRSRTLLYSGII
jgi:probable HAF family extracellular repeat protein